MRAFLLLLLVVLAEGLQPATVGEGEDSQIRRLAASTETPSTDPNPNDEMFTRPDILMRELKANSDPPRSYRQTVRGKNILVHSLVQGGVISTMLGAFIMFRKPEVLQEPLNKATSLLGHMFGGDQLTMEVEEAHLEDCNTIPDCVANLAKSVLGILMPPVRVVLNFATSMGVGITFFFAGMVMVLNGQRIGWVPVKVEQVFSMDAHLSSLSTNEWTLVGQAMALERRSCERLNRDYGLLQLGMGTSNHPSTCGFCKVGFTSSSRLHGPHATDICLEVDDASSANICGLLHRRGGTQPSQCGECLEGYTGPASPSVSACRRAAICKSGFSLIGASGGSKGECVDNCPVGTYTYVSTLGAGLSVCIECDVNMYSDTVDSSECKRCAASVCSGSSVVSNQCRKTGRVENVGCVTTPSFPPRAMAAYSLQFSSRSVAEHARTSSSSTIGAAFYSDRFAIRSAAGPRHGPFKDQTFAYEWHVDSNSNPNAFRTLSIPFGMETPVRMQGVLRTPPGYQRPNSASVLVEVPHGNEIRYRPSNRYLITTEDVFNQEQGSLFDSCVDSDPPTWPAYTGAWTTAKWNSTSQVASAASMLESEGLMVPIHGGSGNWSITLPITLPEDPTIYNCPPLPVRITVTAADGVSRRVYTIHTIGSDRRSCYNNPAELSLSKLKSFQLAR